MYICKILDIPHKEAYRIVPALFAYLFNSIDLEEFIAYVDPSDRTLGTRIKDIARCNGYILKNCKLYAYAVHVARLCSDKKPKPSDFCVDSADARLLQRLNLQHLEGYKAYSLKEFDATLSNLLLSPDLRGYIGRFITRKMSFIIKSFAEPRTDIESFLNEQMLLALYKQYPRFESELHMMNVAKAQAHNKGHSFITAATTQKRQRLRKELDGHQAVNVTLDAILELEYTDYNAEIREKLQSLAALEDSFPERTKEFIMCAAGQHHPGFSGFLNVDNSVAAESMDYTKYMAQLTAYFNTDQNRVDSLYSRIRRKIFSTA